MNRLLLKNKFNVIFFLLSTIILAVIAPLKSYIMEWLIDARCLDAALVGLLKGIIVIICSHILEIISKQTYTKAVCDCIYQIRNEIIGTCIQNSTVNECSDDSNILSMLTNDMRTLYDAYYMNIFNIIFWGSMGIVAFFMLAHISITIMLVTFVLTFIPIGLPIVCSTKLKEDRNRYSKDIADYTRTTKNLLDNIVVFKNSLQKLFFIEKHKYAAQRNKRIECDIQKNLNVVSVGTSFTSWIPITAILFFCVIMVFQEKISMGYLVTVYSLASFVMSPLRMVANAIVQLKGSNAIKKKVESYLHNGKNDKTKNKIKEIERLELKNVCFEYEKNKGNILSNFSYTFIKGKKYAIIGTSGSGKTTLMNILYRCLPSKDGSYLINGINSNDIGYDDFYNVVSYMPQKSRIINDTILNNILLGCQCEKEKLEDIIDICDLKNFINSLEDGFNTVIEADGNNFSSGQIQRIMLARTLVNKNDFILLDEPTANLDAQTAKIIFNNIMKLSCGVIFITHDNKKENLELFDDVIRIEYEP